MLPAEAKWFSEKIDSLQPQDIFPMINVGSSTAQFRKVDQPWIHEYLFKPLMGEVLHVDLKPEAGVDLVGDISEASFHRTLLQANPKSVMCLNLLEHVPHRQEMCRAITSLLPRGGYIFVSCPYEFPFHADPIDTMFRPSPEELAQSFPGTEQVVGAVVVGENYSMVLARNKLKACKTLIRMLLPFYKPQNWYKQAVYFPWLFRNFTATCLILRKT